MSGWKMSKGCLASLVGLFTISGILPYVPYLVNCSPVPVVEEMMTCSVDRSLVMEYAAALLFPVGWQSVAEEMQHVVARP